MLGKGNITCGNLLWFATYKGRDKKTILSKREKREVWNGVEVER